MKEPSKYTVPFYYPTFSCKCGDCRYTCCQRWKVTLSVEEYNRLISIDCSSPLRHRLDGSAYPEERPTPEKFASLLKRPDGFCSLLEPDGYCAFHRECGETALPSVCRYYPRSPKSTFADECSCSCGCEGVTEALLNHGGDFYLTSGEYEFDLPKEPRDNRVSERVYSSVRSRCFDILNYRSATLAMRLEIMGDFLEKIAGARNNAEIEIICDNFKVEYKGIGITDYEPENYDTDTLELQKTLNEIFCSKSPNMSEYSDFADRIFSGSCVSMGYGDSFMDFYDQKGYSNRRFIPSCSVSTISHAEAKKLLYSRYDKLDDKLALLLANHIFFTRFPYGAGGILPSYLSLIAAYALMIYIASGCLAGEKNSDIAPLADVLSSLFRVLDGSSFNLNASKVFIRFGISTFENAKKILFAF